MTISQKITLLDQKYFFSTDKSKSLHFFYHSFTISRPPAMIKNRPRSYWKINPITSTLTIGAVLLFTLIPLSIAKPSFAQVMEGEEYKLRLIQVSDDDPTPTLAQVKTDPTLTPSPTPPLIQSYGQSEILVSDDFVQFGPLSPTNPVIRQLRFSISDGQFPFSLFQQMDHDLFNDPGQSIPATSCDNGSCSDKQASLWISTLTYGLGVRCENLIGTVCPDDFIEKNTFRPLGVPTSYTGSKIASGASREKVEFSLTYKLVVPGTQAPGSYQATVSYILIPAI